jgi:hypothetical protein
MANPGIEEFARVVIERVRDTAIRSCDANLNKSSTNPIARRWREVAEGDAEEFASVLIPDVVDSTIAHFLGAIDQEILRLVFSASNGESVDLASDGLGELSGWYKGSDGWCARYSRERCADDVSDLQHFFDEPPTDPE